MIKSQVLSKIDKVKEISSPPVILNEVLQLVNEPDSSTEELTNIVHKDPSLTAQLLKIANSAFYGMSREITSVSQAIMVMGLNAVKLYVLSISIFNQVNAKKDKSRLDEKLLWTHFLETASASRKIAEHLRYKIPEEAYVAGLLHDIGLILLETNFPREYENVKNLTSNGKSLCEAEKHVFGIDHQKVAEHVAARWNIPLKLREPMRKHHFEDEDDIDRFPLLCKIVGLADCIAQVPFKELNKFSSTQRHIIALNSLSESINVDQEVLLSIHSKLPEEVIISAKAMDLDMGDAVEMLTESNTKLFHIYLELAALFKERQELSRQILIEERMEGTIESFKISLATLSHYINNATMNIQGKCDLVNMFLESKNNNKLMETLPEFVTSIKHSVKKICLILEELSKISSIENINFFQASKAIDIEKILKEKLTNKFEKIEVGK